MNANIENFIGIFEGAYSKEYCNSVINYFEDMSAAGLAVSRKENARVLRTIQDDTQVVGTQEICIKPSKDLILLFNSVFWDVAYEAYSDKFDIIRNTAPHANYSFKVQKTQIGQGFHAWHAENIDRNTSNRFLAWTLYLNDVDEGGETEFLYYSKRIKPKTGTLAIWPAGFAHTHRGNPPISNTKYIVTGWVEF